MDGIGVRFSVGPQYYFMKLFFGDFKENILNFIRECGYSPIARGVDDEWNCARSLQGRDYPRFHCYIKKEGAGLRVNLHLDQKKPSYAGSTSHSGEYEGEIIEQEGERIKQVFARIRG